MNCQFKAGLMQLCGNYSEESLQRTAKSLVISSSLHEKLTPQYVNRFWSISDKIPYKFLPFYSEESMIKDRFGHRTGDWTDQVRKGAQDLCVSMKC